MFDWPQPQIAKELRGFLGLVGYYRKFIRHFGIMVKPLTEQLKKDQMFVWTPAHQQAFSLLKQALCSALVVALPDFSLPINIKTDASGSGVGAVVQQNDHPLAFISKALSPRNQRLTVYEKEYLVYSGSGSVASLFATIRILPSH